MASLLFTVGGAVVNALAFSGTNFIFSMLTDHGAEERKRHDLALKKLQRPRDEWNRDRIETLWQVHIPPEKEINHPHYNVTRPNEQHQFDLLYMPHNLFEGHTDKYILTGIDVASRYKVARPLRTKNSGEVAFLFEAIYNKDELFKYPKTFQCTNGSEFKNEVTKLLEKHNVEIRRATTKYKHTHPAFVEAFNKELAKLLFKPMDAQELQDPEKVSTIWVKNLKNIVNKMNNTESSMTGMKPKDAIKLDTVSLDKTYPEETVLPEDGLYRYLYKPGE